MIFPNPVDKKDEDVLLDAEIENIEDHAADLTSLRWDYVQLAANATGERLRLYHQMKAQEGWSGSWYANQTSAQLAEQYGQAPEQYGEPNKKIGVERGKMMARSHPTYVDIQEQYIKALVKEKKLWGFIDCIDMKRGFIPGIQGRLNRELDSENAIEY